MKTLAAVLVEHNKPLELADLEIPPLQPGQCLVEIAYSGVCGTQIGEWKGTRGPDAYLPHCLGHEASGFVREVNGVRKVKPGDAVICSWMKGSGADVPGTKYLRQCAARLVDFGTHSEFQHFDIARSAPRLVNAGAITTFQRYAVISENRLTPLPDGIDMKAAALLGCPIPTGIGSVWNTAQARPGQSVAVFGCGGVGLSAILGAKVLGCHPIYAVDLGPHKLALAKRCGATHTIDHDQLKAESGSLASALSDPVDIVIEATGSRLAMTQAFLCVRSRGGIAVILGNAKYGESLSVPVCWFNEGKQLRGSWGGDNAPDLSFPVYAKLMQAGQLDVGPLLGETYPLTEINSAMAAMADGCAGRPIISMANQA